MKRLGDIVYGLGSSPLTQRFGLGFLVCVLLKVSPYKRKAHLQNARMIVPRAETNAVNLRKKLQKIQIKL
jgi:hypothetical protein